MNIVSAHKKCNTGIAFIINNFNSVYYIISMVIVVFLMLTVVCSSYLMNLVSAQVVVAIDNTSGDFEVTVGGIPWFQSGPVELRSGGVLYTTKNNTLLFKGVSRSVGLDNLGDFLMHRIEWSTSTGTTLIGNMREYACGDTIVFEQSFESDISGTSTGDENSLISSFPSFRLTNSEGGGGTGYVHWDSWHNSSSLPSTFSDIKQSEHNAETLPPSPAAG